MSIYPPNTTNPKPPSGNYLWNWLGTPLKKFAAALQPYLTGTGVTSVSATAPVQSTGGATPVISLPAANATTDGYITAATFNSLSGKQDAISLTTSGTQGQATLVGSTLNIPNYNVIGNLYLFYNY